ncbi:MAG TPA: class I SAM-dependent methyltransferase [Tepidisphaeraceae bacterium]|jgi:SAM-dependent methyltransferase|nr:class I SAM-dependent methyltransferase [Tepidisphaeraceae bacterium]
MSGAEVAKNTGPIDWDEVHRFAPGEAMPWYYPRLDPDVAWAMNLLDVRVPTVLDLGTSNGTQAIELARHGLDVTATDVSPTAIADATARARQAGVRCRFVVDDVLNSRLNAQFDFVVDRGCLHVLPVEQRSEYVNSVAKLVRLRGHLFLKCASDKYLGNARAPHKFSPQQIKDLFAGSPFFLCEIRSAIFFSNVDPPPPALFCILRRM